MQFHTALNMGIIVTTIINVLIIGKVVRRGEDNFDKVFLGIIATLIMALVTLVGYSIFIYTLANTMGYAYDVEEVTTIVKEDIIPGLIYQDKEDEEIIADNYLGITRYKTYLRNDAIEELKTGKGVTMEEVNQKIQASEGRVNHLDTTYIPKEDAEEVELVGTGIHEFELSKDGARFYRLVVPKSDNIDFEEKPTDLNDLKLKYNHDNQNKYWLKSEMDVYRITPKTSMITADEVELLTE